MNSASPAAEKLKNLRLKMTPEEKDAQREKERIVKSARRLVDFLTDDVYFTMFS